MHLRCVYWRQHTVGFCLIQTAALCLFIGEFSPFTFSVIIDVCGFFNSNFMFCFLVALCLHWFFPFVFLSVVFLWWYSILLFYYYYYILLIMLLPLSRFSPLSPSTQHYPISQAIPIPLLMSVGHMHKFIGHSISFTVLLYPCVYSVTTYLYLISSPPHTFP